MQHPGLIILAAGASTRMGRPKQLLPWNSETLLRHACRTALVTACTPVIVVLGHEAEQCRDHLADLPVIPVINEQWQQGLGRSVACGIAELERQTAQPSAALLMVADQPTVTAELLRSLEQQWQEEPKTIVATAYTEGSGVPALFPQAYFHELKSLSSDQGARVVIRRNPENVRLIKSPTELFDLDTPEAYEARLQSE